MGGFHQDRLFFTLKEAVSTSSRMPAFVGNSWKSFSYRSNLQLLGTVDGIQEIERNNSIVRHNAIVCHSAMMRNNAIVRHNVMNMMRN